MRRNSKIVPANRAVVREISEIANATDVIEWGIVQALNDQGVELEDIHDTRFAPSFDESGWLDQNTFLLVGTVEIQPTKARIGHDFLLVNGKILYKFAATIERKKYPRIPRP